MARILYGVSGEGSGHAMRSREVIRHLTREGHTIELVTYGRALTILANEVPTIAVEGLHIEYRANSVLRLKTAWKNTWRAHHVLASFLRVREEAERFRPDLVMTDFEPISAHVAQLLGIPLLSVDNIHHVVFRRQKVPLKYQHDWVAATTVARLMVPQARRYIVTVLWPEDFGREDVVSTAPLVRPEMLRAHPTIGGHVTVYDSFASATLPKVLRYVPYECRVYGYGRNERQGNIWFRPFSEASFMEDISTARAVIGTGGFTLMSECLAMRKPYFAIPIAHQFEQIENGLLIEARGVGKMSLSPKKSDIDEFFAMLDVYREALDGYEHPGNDAPLAEISKTVRLVIAENHLRGVSARASL